MFRAVGAWGDESFGNAPFALRFGGGSGNTANFTLTVSEDITLNSCTGLGARFNTNPLFNVTGTGVMSGANTFGVLGSLASTAPGTETFSGGPLFLTGGATYLFTTTNNGPATTGFFTSFDFSTAAPAVPLPAGLPLLLAGLGTFGLMRRRRG